MQAAGHAGIHLLCRHTEAFGATISAPLAQTARQPWPGKLGVLLPAHG